MNTEEFKNFDLQAGDKIAFKLKDKTIAFAHQNGDRILTDNNDDKILLDTPEQEISPQAAVEIMKNIGKTHNFLFSCLRETDTLILFQIEDI